MRLISSRALMGDALNGRAVNVIGWVTTVAISGASAGLIATSLPQSR
jgi:Mn2+/Fe2+ NRAMP family transporter